MQEEPKATCQGTVEYRNLACQVRICRESPLQGEFGS